MSGTTVRFAAEFDDSKLIQGLNSVKSSLQETFANQSGIQALEQDMAGLQTELGQLEQSTNALEQGFTGLDSASTGIGGSFQEIGDAANQTGDSFNTLETSGATIQQQLESIGTTSSTMGQSMQALGADVDTTTTSMGALASNFEETTGTSATLMQGLDDSTASFKGLGEEAESTGSTLKDMFSKGSGVVIGISAAISGIANLVRGFRDYDDAQLKVRKGQRLLSLAQEAAGKAQDKYNAAVAEFGVNSKEAAAELLNVQQAQSKLANQTDQLAIQTKRAGDAQIDIWLGLGGTVTGIGGSIMQVLTGLGGEKGLAGLAGKAKLAKTALVGLGPLLVEVGLGAAVVVAAIPGLAAQFSSLAKVLDPKTGLPQKLEETKKMMELAAKPPDPASPETWLNAMGINPITGALVKLFIPTMDKAIEKSKEYGTGIATPIPNTKLFTGAIDTATTAVNTHIPTVIHLSSSVRSLGYDTREAYTIGAKALDMFNVEQQKSTETSKIATEGFAKLSGVVATLPPAVESTNKAVTSSTDVYTAWINKGVDPANQIINELSKSVRNGVIPQDQLGKAVELAADKLQAAGVVTEGNREQTILLATAHLKTAPAVDAAAKALEEYKATMADAKRINDEYTKAIEDNTQTYIDIAKEGHEWDDVLTTLNSVTGQHIMKTDADAESLKGLAGALKTSRTAFKAEEVAIGVVIDKHGLLTTAMEQAILDNKDDVVALKQVVIEHTNWNVVLGKSKEQLDALTDGQYKAVTAMEEYTKNLVSAAAEEKQTHAELLKMVDLMGIKLPAGLNLTNDQLKTITDNFYDTKQAAAELAAQIEGPMNESFSAFSDIITAVTKQDFKDAFKELKTSLEHVMPEGTGQTIKHIKDMFKELNQELFKGPDVAKAIDVLFVAIASGTDKLTSKDIKNVIDGIKNSLDSMGSVNPRAAMVSQEVFGPLEKLDGAALTSKIGQIGDTIDLVKKAEADGWIDASEYAAIHHQLGVDLGTIPGPAGEAAGGIDKTGVASGLAAPKLDAVAASLTSVNLAAADVAKKMSELDFEFAPPKLDLVADALNSVLLAGQDVGKRIGALKYNLAAPNIQAATNAMKSVEVNWRGYANKISSLKPTITVINKQALNAISAVISKMNSVKNISRTITITTRYVTVGRPAAHNVTGIKAHNITGAGGDGATETPITALTTGGSSQIINNTNGGGGGPMGDVNITIINRDEFGIEKQRKFKAVLGKDRYIFGSVGAGG